MRYSKSLLPGVTRVMLEERALMRGGERRSKA
jgi:hypothetical protein